MYSAILAFAGAGHHSLSLFGFYFVLGSTVFSGTLFHTLKKVLRAVIVDKTDGFEGKSYMKRFCKEDTTGENYVDDLETGGPGLAQEKTEGEAMSTGTMREGYITRYLVRTFAQKLVITREAMEDCKYEKAIQLAPRLKRSMIKTWDIDATNMLIRAANTSYVGGDGQPLASASHTLPGGGTFSNTMGTPMTPSRAAMIVATSSIRKLPGHDGITEGYEPKCIVCPTEQWAVWSGIVNSAKAPEAGQFNEINVVNRDLNIQDVVAIPYWTNTTTNWGIVTDCDNGLNFIWRRKPTSDDWIDNDHQTYKFGISARWTRGWSDPRAFFFSNI